MSQVAALAAKMSELLVEAKALADNAERSADDDRRADEVLAQLNKMRPEYERAKALEDAGKQADAFQQPVRRLGAQTAEPGAEEAIQKEQARDHRSIGRRFIDSDEFKFAREKRLQHVPPVAFDGLLNRPTRDEAIDEARALIYSGTAPASLLLPMVLPTIYRPAELPLVMRDVLLNLPTQSDTITVMQETGFTNAAVEVAEATTVSGGLKPESALTFSQVNFPVATIAHWVPITRQMIDDIPFMQTYVNDRLLVGLARREDAEFLNGDGTGANLTGIFNTSGIQILDSAYFTGNPVQNVGLPNENYERLLRAKIKIMTTGFAMASFIVANPTDLEKVITATNAQKAYLFPGLANGDINGSIAGLPVVWDPNCPVGSALVGDGTMAAVADRRQGQIFTADQHSDFFVRNLFVILAEERVALPVFRPVAFAKVALV